MSRAQRALSLLLWLWLGVLAVCALLGGICWSWPGSPPWARAGAEALLAVASLLAFLPPLLLGCLVVLSVVVGAPLQALRGVGGWVAGAARAPFARLADRLLVASPVLEPGPGVEVWLPEAGVPFRYRFELGPALFRLRWTHDFLERGGGVALTLALPLLAIAIAWVINSLPAQLRGIGLEGGDPRTLAELLPGFAWSLGFALAGSFLVGALVRRTYELTFELEHRGPLRITRRPFLGTPRVVEVDPSQVRDVVVVGDEDAAACLALVLRAEVPGLGTSRSGESAIAILTWLPPGAAALLRHPLAQAQPFLQALLKGDGGDSFAGCSEPPWSNNRSS